MLEAYHPPCEASDTSIQPSLVALQHRQTLQPSPSELDPSYGGGTPSLPHSGNDKTSLDFTQRIERKLAEYNASQNAFKRWLFEIISWLISAICMGAIIAIYASLNTSRMSQVGLYLTYANVLGKIASAALIVPTTEALGQLKWNWFQKSQVMWDFEIFDKASRGPLGAALLLFRTKGRSLAALGALLIVLLLAIDTFFQQVTEFPDRWALQNTTSAIPRVVRYAPAYLKEYWQNYEETQYDKDLRPIIREYLLNNGTQPITFGNGTRPDIPLSCPTSKCTWPVYETLAVCSNCVDVSESLNLTFACLNTTVDWSVTWTGPLRDIPYPNGTVCGYFLNATSAAPTLMSGFTIPNNATNQTAEETLLVRALPLTHFLTKERLYNTGSINFNLIRNPISDFLIASARQGSESVYRRERPIVHECLLSWCVQAIKSSYDHGRYQEEIQNTYQNTTAGPSPWLSFRIPEAGGTWLEYNENITIAPPASRLDKSPAIVTNAVYGLDNATTSMAMATFDDFFPSSYTTFEKFGVPQLRYREYDDGPHSRSLHFNPWLAPNNITKHVERLAIALTNSIRSSQSGDMLAGEAYQQETYVKIKWEWLSFPFALLSLSLIFLVSTIIKTSSDGETGIWKNSAMPTLIYSLPKETQGQFASSSTWNSGKGGPRKTRIKLMPSMGWRVSGQICTPPSPSSLRPNNPRAPPGWV